MDRIKSSNPKIGKNEEMVNKMIDDHSIYLEQIDYDPFFKTELVKILGMKVERDLFFNKAIQDGIKKGYFDNSLIRER